MTDFRMYIEKSISCLLLICLITLFTYDFTHAQQKQINIIYIGNSITYGVRLKEREKSSPAAVCTSLLKSKKGVNVIKQANCAVSGRTTLDFLPESGKNIQKVTDSADVFYRDNGNLVFSIKLGTNDSAMQGPNGAPVSIVSYAENLKKIIQFLAVRYPKSLIVVHHPIWYSPNTYNRSKYLQDGLLRLQSYFPEIDLLVKQLKEEYPNRIYLGDTKAFNVFKKRYKEILMPENGQQGVFYLHPNEKGAKVLGELWANAIYKALKKSKY